MQATLDMEDGSELSIWVEFSYWPGMKGTYYDPPESSDADWIWVGVDEGKTSRTLTADKQEVFEAWWDAKGRDLACQHVEKMGA
jgi:hypothetical protein